jgi:hypothetical protein
MMMVSLLFAFGPTQLALITPAHADITLPSYAAGGDVKTKVESVGKKVTDTISLVVAVIAILCMVASGGYFASGKSDEGKRLLFGSITGLVVAGMAYGIAALVT